MKGALYISMRVNHVALLVCLPFCLAAADAVAEAARDRQDRPALEKLVATRAADAARRGNDASAHYRLALAQSYLAEVATELRDKEGARRAAEAGIKSAERAVALDGNSSEHHRILGTLCGQVIPANVLSGLTYGRCAMDGINKAIEKDPKSAIAYVSRGVGNYYLPAAFGGGPERALVDLRKALELDPELAEAHLWTGIVKRKLGRNKEARDSFARALKSNPRRVWAKQQLDKTPAN